MSDNIERIKPGMNLQDMVMAMGDSNFGAIRTCADIVNQGPEVHSSMGVPTLLDLDRIGVYEDRLWVLYSDICERKVPLIGAVALGNRFGVPGAETDIIQDSVDKAYKRQEFPIEPLTVARSLSEILPDFTVDSNQ